MAGRREISRREFIKRSGGAAATIALPTIITGQALGAPGVPPASERVRIGFIGIANRGRQNLRHHVQDTVAVCDVDRGHLAEAKATVEKATGRKCEAYSDYRSLLENKDVDAVVVTTPDHWHALIAIDACMAGKDVYCEKPLTLTIAEGRAMVNAARRYGRIVQTGSQQRSGEQFRYACQLVREGKLGKLHTVRAGASKVNFPGPAVPDGDPPAELDYDFWLGPAPQKPYNEKHVHYNFRFFWDYSGGQMTNWGAHNNDIAQWGLGMDTAGPLSAEGRARYQPQHWYEVPEWFEAVYEYPGGVKLICGMDQPGGTTFEGEKGSLHVTRGALVAKPAELVEAGHVEKESDMDRKHHQNWLECIKSRKRPDADLEIGHRSATVCHLGNIAILTGRKLTWDPVKEEIVGDAEAARMVSRPYRAPWRLAAR